MPCPAGAGAGRLQEAASDARAVPSPRGLSRAPEGSSGARPRQGFSAPPVRAGTGSGASGAGANPMPPETGDGHIGRS